MSFQKDIQLFVDKAEPILRNVSVSNSRKTLPELKHSVAHVEAHCHHVNNTLQQALLNNASTAKHLASHGEAMQHAVAFFVSQHLEMTGVNLEEIVASAAQSAAAQQAAAVQEDEQDDYFYSSAYHGSDYENDMDNGMMAYGAKLAGKGYEWAFARLTSLFALTPTPQTTRSPPPSPSSLRRKKAGGGTPAGKGVRDWNYRRRLDDFENDRLPEYWIDWKAPLHDTPVVSPSEWQTSKVVSSPVPAPVQPCQETVLAPPTDSSAQARVQPQVQPLLQEPPKEQHYLRRHGKSPVGATGIDLPVVTVVQASSNPAHYPAEESGSDQETECDVDEIDIDDTFDLDRDDFEQVLEDERMECTV